MAGLHYLKDIDIPKNIVKLRPKIEDGSINDEYLRKSKMYNTSSDNVKDVEPKSQRSRKLLASGISADEILEKLK